VAVNYIDRVVRRREQVEWRDATQLIGQRLRYFAFATITNIRSAIGLSSRQLSMSGINKSDKAAYLKLCESEIEPAVDGLVRRLDQRGWKSLADVLQMTYRDCQDLLTLFGNRIRPSEFRELLALQDDIHGVLATYTTFPDVLGVADDKLQPNNRGDQIEFKHAATRQLAAQTSAIVRRVRKLGALALEFEAQAASLRVRVERGSAADGANIEWPISGESADCFWGESGHLQTSGIGRKRSSGRVLRWGRRSVNCHETAAPLVHVDSGVHGKLRE
jgi:hypothetical protein